MVLRIITTDEGKILDVGDAFSDHNYTDEGYDYPAGSSIIRAMPDIYRKKICLLKPFAEGKLILHTIDAGGKRIHVAVTEPVENVKLGEMAKYLIGRYAFSFGNFCIATDFYHGSAHMVHKENGEMIIEKIVDVL